MTVEAANHINELNPALPPNGDPLGEGDDHLRKIKLVLQNDFPNITGPVTATQATLNALVVPSVANTALSALTPAADRVPYFTGATTAALATFTAYGRSLVAAVDAAAARLALGLGALALKATVATADIDNSAVTLAKVANMATNSLLGRSTGGTGVPEVITVSTGLALTAGALTAPGATRPQTTFDKVVGPGLTGTTILSDASIPLISEGTQVFSRAFTPTLASNTIRIEGDVFLGGPSNSADNVVVLFNGSTCVAVFPVEAVSTGCSPVHITWEEPAVNTTVRTYSVRFGGSAGGVRLNEAASGDDYGGKVVSSMTITERA